MRLHIIDLLISAAPFRLRAKAFDPFHHHAAIPGAVENRDVSGLGNPRPEAPQIMMGFFQRTGRSRRADLIASGIQMAGKPADRPAFSSGVPSLEA